MRVRDSVIIEQDDEKLHGAKLLRRLLLLLRNDNVSTRRLIRFTASRPYGSAVSVATRFGVNRRVAVGRSAAGRV